MFVFVVVVSPDARIRGEIDYPLRVRLSFREPRLTADGDGANVRSIKFRSLVYS